MIKGIFLTGNSLESKFKSIDVVANNIANINTIGFKRQVPFSEILKENGGRQIKQVTDFSQGEVTRTANPLDLAISGDGFFTLKTDDGVQLTRNGKFKLDDDGFLINEQGYKVLGKKGEINIFEFQLDKDSQITVSQDGLIKVGETEIDSLLISKRDKDTTLDRAEGLNFYNEENVDADPTSYKISQGYLEESNVNPIIEMEQMIQKNKEYETAYKVMGSLDQSLKNAIEIGKV